MSDQMERDIEEIMNRLGEPAPREGARERVRRLVRGWTAGLKRTGVSRLVHVSARQFKVASLALVVLVGAGLFLGLVYPGPSLIGGGSAGGEITQEGAADQMDEGSDSDDAWQDGSGDEALGTDGRESAEEADHGSDGHEESDGDSGQGHH